jgi:P pilus assembly chaperone PapD
MNALRKLFAIALLASASLIVPAGSARAELLLSQLIVELDPGTHSRADIEIWNNGPERSFVSVAPREILAPGTPAEAARVDPDPEKLGLLVSPARMILEPGQRKLLRIASLAADSREHVYRVTVKPVVGALAAEKSGLKLLVGYDALVIVRPSEMRMRVGGTRSADLLTLHNEGNVSVELTEGKACDASGKVCTPLPGGRLYANAEMKVKVPLGLHVGYQVKLGSKLVPLDF